MKFEPNPDVVPAGYLVSVEAVDIDVPGDVGYCAAVKGWILGQSEPPQFLRIATTGAAVARAPVDIPRTDVVAALQVTYAKVRAFFMHEAPVAAYYRRVDGMIVDILPHAAAHPEGVVTMFDYDLNAVFALLSEFGSSPMITIPSDEGEHLSLQVIFVRQK